MINKGDCDLCGRWDGALAEGVCGECRERYVSGATTMSDAMREAFEALYEAAWESTAILVGHKSDPECVKELRSRISAAYEAGNAATEHAGRGEPVAYQWRSKRGNREWRECDPETFEYYRNSDTHEVRELFVCTPAPAVPEGVEAGAG